MSASLILAIKSLNQLPPKQRCIICLITQSGYPGFGYPPTPPKESPGGVDPSTPSPMPGQSFLGYHNDRLFRVIFLSSIMITLIYCSKPSNTSKWLRGRGGDTQPTPSCELLSTQSIPLSSTPSPSPPPQLSQLSPPWPQPLYRARTLLVVTVNRSTWSLPPTTWCKAWPSAILDQGPRWTVSMMMVMIWWWWWWWAHEFWAVIFHGSNWRCAPKRSWWLNSRHLEFRARHCHVIIALPWLPPSLLVLQFSPAPVEILKWFLHFIRLSFAWVKFTSISIAYIYDPFVASVYIADFFMQGF